MKHFLWGLVAADRKVSSSPPKVVSVLSPFGRFFCSRLAQFIAPGRWRAGDGRFKQVDAARPRLAPRPFGISTVTNKGQMRWKAFDGAVNSDILIDFLSRLIKDAGRKIYLILDNLGVHHSKPVKAWLVGHKDEIEVFYLPSYSLELNPNEMANAGLKQAVTKLVPARTKLQLVKATAKHLRSVQRQAGRIKSYFEHEPVRYAA